MVYDLKFCKFDDTPWGFRLVGGADYKIPLTVSRVMEGGLAEQAGLKSGDVIVRINDTPTIKLTHNEAHDALKKTGNNFMLGILREEIEEQFNDEYSPIQTPIMFNDEIVVNGNHAVLSPILSASPAEITVTNHCEMSCVSNSCHMTSTNMSSSTCEINEMNESSSDVTDDQIAEIISGEAEVLKEHNILGVNFQKIIPQSGMIKGSDVFKQLNAEAIKTKEEKEKEDRKWTTFLQKPNRPVPKKRNQVVVEVKNQPYKVNIVKQPKPRVAPDRIATPDVPEAVPEPVIELTPEPAPQYVEYLNEDQYQVESQINLEVESSVECAGDQMTAAQEDKSEHHEENSNEGRISAATESLPVPQKTPEELLLEQQLLDIQKQLLALSTLPTAIQSTLDAITSQLSKIVPAMMPQNANPRPISASTCDEVHSEDMLTDVSICGDSRRESRNDDLQIDETNEVIDAGEDADSEREDDNEEVDTTADGEYNEINGEREEIEAPLPKLTEEELAIIRQEEMLKARETEWMNTRHREQEELEAEHQQRLISQRSTPHPPPRPKTSVFGPLVPQERPIFLPGGRRWRSPKDAFNEEFIAEIISSQAELITGTTLGNTYESPILGYDNRESNCYLSNRKLQKVNFLKYQKPEKDLSNLKNSEVFKMVHNLDKQPRHGIEARPEKVISEQDARLIAC